MSPDRTRRALLASIGALGTAGCLTDTSSDEPDTPSVGTTDRSGSDPDTGTASPTDSRDRTTTPTTASTTTEPTPETPDAVTTEWPVPGVDQGRTNYAADAAGPTDPVGELWSVQTDVPLSTPVVAAGTVYVGGTDGVVRAVDARTGGQTWQRSVGATGGDRPARPRVRDGRLYVEGDGALVALDAADGTELWRVATGAVRALLVADHGVYLTERADDSFVRRSLADGSERWRTTVDETGPSGTVVASDEYVFFTHPRTSGPWSLPVEDGRRDFEESERQPTPLPYHSPSPQCYHDGRLYNANTFSGSVEAMTPPAPPFDSVWNRRWDPTEGGFRLAVDDEAVYVVTGGDSGPVLRSLSLSDGSQQWRRSVGAPSGAPVVTDETVLAPTAGGLVCLDPRDGRVRWRQSHAGIGESVVVAADVVFTAADRTLAAFRSVSS